LGADHATVDAILNNIGEIITAIKRDDGAMEAGFSTFWGFDSGASLLSYGK